MDPTQNIFSYCVGGLALMSTITSVLLYCRLYMPSTQLKRLDELLIETKDIYRRANEENLLPPAAFSYAQTRLRRYEDETDILREVTYRTRSCADTVLALFRGHTKRIMDLADDVGTLRAFLMTTSQKEKKERREHALQQNLRYPEAPSEVTQFIDSPDESVTGAVPDRVCTESHGQLAASQSSPLHDASRPPYCSVFSLWGRFVTRSDVGLAPIASSREEQGFTISNANTLSKTTTSTLVDAEAQSPCKPRSWLSRVVRPFLHTQIDSVSSSPCNETLQTRRDSAITLPV